VLSERTSAAARLAYFLDVLLGQENVSGLQILMAMPFLRSVERIANLCGVLQCLTLTPGLRRIRTLLFQIPGLAQSRGSVKKAVEE
jgi:hypothetical protein